ncbi:MAG: hypothetical protein KatS3mg051_1188 [Anaerolineae bacterium]|nr:MAG: hypothetical protein KatS3mg051_1078 [Anaerolineae bacterium]GIV81834.1 MAG: hypothetical protein KatS3mg051_1188 [Anaerolineae bacterium]
MTWTYSGDPAASSRDAVRFLIGDTDTNDQQITDEEIAWLLAQNGNTYVAAAAACESIAAKYARNVDASVDSARVDASQRQAHYLALAKKLRSRAAYAAVPFAGGISESDKDTREDDTDRVEPAFTRDLHRNPGTVSLRDLCS